MQKSDQHRFAEKYRIGTMRLKGWDYSSPAVYFITINTKDRWQWFGHINNNRMNLSDIGKVAHECWEKIPDHFSFVELDKFQIMPNHMHGILGIGQSVIAQLPEKTPIYYKYNVDNNKMGVLSRDTACRVSTENDCCREYNSRSKIVLQDFHTNRFGPLTKNSLQSVINLYKGSVARFSRKNGNQEFCWQARFYEKRIRSQKELNRIRKYISDNPISWQEDDDNLTKNMY